MNNNECKGYALKAMKEAGLKKKTIIKVISEMEYAFDIMTEKQAEEFYKKSDLD